MAGSRLILLLTAPVLLAGSACQRVGADAEADGAVRGVVAAFDSAWSRKDTTAASGLLAPAYVYFSSRGGVTPRQETLDLLGAPHYRLEYADRSELDVHLLEGAAVVGSRWRGRGTYQGKEFVDDQRCSLVLGRGPDGWRLLSEHCTQIAG